MIFFDTKKELEIKNIGPDKYSILLRPLEKGFGHILGIVFRRIFLSFLGDYIITKVRIDGVLHEFMSKKGILEDVIDVLSNIKKIKFKFVGFSRDLDNFVVSVKKKGICKITAKDFLVSSNISIFNPDLLIATIVDDVAISIDVMISRGNGYNNKIETQTSDSVGWLHVNFLYTPILRFFFKVDQIFLNGCEFDQLNLIVTTNGVVNLRKCIYDAIFILFKQLPFPEFFKKSENAFLISDESNSSFFLLKKIDELDISVSLLNILKDSGIVYIRDLVEKTEVDLRKFLNFNEIFILEIKEALFKFGFSFEIT